MDSTWIILIPAMLFAFYAQAKVSSAYRKYSAVGNRQGISGTRAARQILDNNGLSSVPIEIVAGKLTDHYDPRTRIMRLSPEVHNGTSIAAVSIAAHEAGHAIQHATSYAPLKIRNAIAPVVSIASNLAWPLLLIGLATGYLGLFDLGIVLFASALLFQAITLPVEFDASKRAIAQLQALAIIQDEEAGSAKKVLSAAAMTYVAAMAVSLANLLRLLMLRNRS
jgi:Zn-dependent membrane protease YugP